MSEGRMDRSEASSVVCSAPAIAAAITGIGRGRLWRLRKGGENGD